MADTSVIQNERLRTEVENWARTFEKTYTFKESYQPGEQNQQIHFFEGMRVAAQLMLVGGGVQVIAQTGADGISELVVRAIPKATAPAA
jgi:hypothetical protein